MKRAGRMADRVHPVDRLLVRQRSVLTIATLLVRRPRPPLLIQHAERCPVRSHGVCVDHFESARPIERRADGTEVLRSPPVGQLETRTVHDDVHPGLVDTPSKRGFFDGGEHRPRANLTIPEKIVGALLLCTAPEDREHLAPGLLRKRSCHPHEPRRPPRITEICVPEFLVRPPASRAMTLIHGGQTGAGRGKFPSNRDIRSMPRPKRGRITLRRAARASPVTAGRGYASAPPTGKFKPCSRSTKTGLTSVAEPSPPGTVGGVANLLLRRKRPLRKT